MKRFSTSTIIISLALALGFAAQAALVSEDFNGLNIANLTGQGGGSGWSGNWYGSTTPKVVAGSLTYANYLVTQSTGDACRQSNSESNNDRQDARDVAAADYTNSSVDFLSSITDVGTTARGLTSVEISHAWELILDPAVLCEKSRGDCGIHNSRLS
ncbi:MAG: hypothetical protein RRC34_13590 [Lentisphaeria bacterium]|nr:hypothetical protein [Lentisphaeria bacterium]